MRIAGIILLVIGIIGTLYYGFEALNNSETVSAFGVDVAVSSANWTPVIVSALVLLVGIFLTSRSKRTR
ncbi:MAG: hypothetical protein R6U66_09350 [Bacteroidales bacterium]